MPANCTSNLPAHTNRTLVTPNSHADACQALAAAGMQEWPNSSSTQAAVLQDTVQGHRSFSTLRPAGCYASPDS